MQQRMPARGALPSAPRSRSPHLQRQRQQRQVDVLPAERVQQRVRCVHRRADRLCVARHQNDAPLQQQRGHQRDCLAWRQEPQQARQRDARVGGAIAQVGWHLCGRARSVVRSEG